MLAENDVQEELNDISVKREETTPLENEEGLNEKWREDSNTEGTDKAVAPEDELSSPDQETLISELEKRAEEAERRAEENYQRFLRNQADFENYRKRVVKEKEEITKYGVKPLMEKLLPVVDNLERAMLSGRGEGASVESFIQGIEMVHRQLIEAMKSEGAIPLETLGKPFDPYYHQAVAQEENAGEKGIVLEEYQRGYLLKDKLLRPAMVKVSS